MSSRRPLSDTEKADLIRLHGMRCFIDGHPIDSEDDLEFDHIKAVAAGGSTSLDNLAPVCKKHNRQKRTMALSEYRDYLALRRFFDDGEAKYLDDVITARGHTFAGPLTYEVHGDTTVTLYLENGPTKISLFRCPITGWQYFYALLPVVHITNDRDLQPRALRHASMWGLYRHFQHHTQLAPSICRLGNKGHLLLFDGQHKAAAQIWAGRTAVECKVYVEPNAKRIKETNLEAHQSYRQMTFYSYELMKKYADICGEDWEDYTTREGVKSEQGFVDFLVSEKKMTYAKARKQVERAIHWRVLNDSSNKLGEFISEKNRTRKQPLSYARIEKTFFRYLLSPVPSSAEFQSATDFRDTEEANLVRLMSIIAEEGLQDRWSPERNDAAHARTQRMFSAGAIRAWTRILRDVLNAYLQLYLRGPDEVHRVLHRALSNDQFEWIRRFIRRIFAHSIWDAPETSDQEISRALTKDDDTTALALLRHHGLETEWVLQSVASGT